MSTCPAGTAPTACSLTCRLLAFLREQAASARCVTSVRTASLVLGAAGPLKGYRATTRWSGIDVLELLGAIPTQERVRIDRNRMMSGVPAGIDFALTLVAGVVDRRASEPVRLRLECDPAPPFAAGSPRTVPPEVVAGIWQRMAPKLARPSDLVERETARLARPVTAEVRQEARIARATTPRTNASSISCRENQRR